MAEWEDVEDLEGDRLRVRVVTRPWTRTATSLKSARSSGVTTTNSTFEDDLAERGEAGQLAETFGPCASGPRPQPDLGTPQLCEAAVPVARCDLTWVYGWPEASRLGRFLRLMGERPRNCAPNSSAAARSAALVACA